MDRKYTASELLSDLAAIVDDELRQGGGDRLGERVATRIAFEWGGQRVYIAFDRPRRNARIYSLFRGDNYAELARIYHMAEHSVRRIVSEERERRRVKQLSFFPSADQDDI